MSYFPTKVNYLYLGKITKVSDDGVLINAMEKSLNSWRCQQKEDQLFYPWDKAWWE